MVDYPDLSSLSNTSGLQGILTLPNASYPFFWVFILGAIWVVISFSIYYRDKSLTGRGNLLSSMAVASLACIMLGLIATLIEILTVTTFIPILVFGIVIIVIWMFSNPN